VHADLQNWNAEITKANATIYASKFTDAQLLDMLMFYRSDGARALVAQTPSIIREKSELGRKLMTERMPILVEKTCAKLNCSKP
jgi:hypothetical protein